MLLLDIFLTAFRQAQLGYLSESQLINLSTVQFSLHDLQLAESKKDAAYRQLFYELSQLNIQEAQADYDQFLLDCRAQIGAQETAYLLPITLSYFSSKKSLDICRELLSYNFRGQNDARALVPLGQKFIHQPTCFAAFLTWLQKQGVTVADLLSTHIIHDYALYHLVDEGEEDPREYLHQTLAANPETEALARAMEVTACRSGELAYFSLNGVVCEENTLNIVERLTVTQTITSSEENANALLRLFGINLFVYALQNPNALSAVKHLIIDDIPNLLERIRQNSSSSLDLISLLTFLLDFLVHEKRENAYLVFKELITSLFIVLLQFPLVLDDDLLFQVIRKYKMAPEYLTEYVRKMEDDFVAICQAERFDYVSINDFWQASCVKFAAIKDLFPRMQTTMPLDKYKFYAALAKYQMERFGVWFDLTRFVRDIGIVPVYDTSRVSEYERFLLELLVTFDSNDLREKIVGELQAVISTPRSFISTNYAAESISERATLHGNLGLLKYLSQIGVEYSRAELKSYVNAAASGGHWHVVSYFYKQYALTQDTVNNLLQCAVQQQAANYIPCLFQQDKCNPQLNQVEKGFINAIKNHDIKSTLALLTCSIHPCITIIVKGFNLAVDSVPEQLDTIRLIVRHIAPNLLLEDAIRAAFVKAAASRDKIEIITFLKNNPAITQRTVDDAYVRAKRSGREDNANCILNFGIIKPSQAALAKLKKRAIDNQTSASTDYKSFMVVSKKSRNKKRNRNNLSRQGGLKSLVVADQSQANASLTKQVRFTYYTQVLLEAEDSNATEKTNLSAPKLVRCSSC